MRPLLFTIIQYRTMEKIVDPAVALTQLSELEQRFDIPAFHGTPVIKEVNSCNYTRTPTSPERLH